MARASPSVVTRMRSLMRVPYPMRTEAKSRLPPMLADFGATWIRRIFGCRIVRVFQNVTIGVGLTRGSFVGFFSHCRSSRRGVNALVPTITCEIAGCLTRYTFIDKVDPSECGTTNDMLAGHRIAALLSFEGPDRYSSIGGLGTRETSFARALGEADIETHLYFVGDPGLPAVGRRLRRALPYTAGPNGSPHTIRAMCTMAKKTRFAISRQACLVR